MSDLVADIKDSDFEQSVLKSQLPTIVDFWAPWCPPCKTIAPILEELSKEYAGKIAIKKINIDENPSTPAEYRVRGIPNLLFFKGGSLVEQLVGAHPKRELIKVIEEKLL
jgi:thioredoxin 1